MLEPLCFSKKLFHSRGNKKLLPWDKGKATYLGGSLHKTDIAGKSKATNTGAYTVIKGEHINEVQAAEGKSYRLIKDSVKLVTVLDNRGK